MTLKFDSYPEHIQPQLSALRALILSVAQDLKIDIIEETLKWGEPSYLVKGGSTIRIDWKPKDPKHYCLYFNCHTTLVETFKDVYGTRLSYQGNRAIVFELNEVIPIIELKHCISLALRCHHIKHLPLLGA